MGRATDLCPDKEIFARYSVIAGFVAGKVRAGA